MVVVGEMAGNDSEVRDDSMSSASGGMRGCVFWKRGAGVGSCCKIAISWSLRRWGKRNVGGALEDWELRSNVDHISCREEVCLGCDRLLELATMVDNVLYIVSRHWEGPRDQQVPCACGFLHARRHRVKYAFNRAAA